MYCVICVSLLKVASLIPNRARESVQKIWYQTGRHSRGFGRVQWHAVGPMAVRVFSRCQVRNPSLSPSLCILREFATRALNAIGRGVYGSAGGALCGI